MYELNGMSVAPAVAQPPIVPAELNHPIQFVWRGSLDAGVRELAGQIGYRVSVWAPKKNQPLAVAVNVSNVMALDPFSALGKAVARRG